jgi:pimeloyl-ACP methyl ester carboxylesterase
MQQVAGNVHSYLVKDCKHWVAEEQPQELVDQLLKFFQKV